MNFIGRTERKIEMTFIEKIIAGLIERTCKNYLTTIVGVSSSILYFIVHYGSLIPAQYSTQVNAGAVVLMGVTLILAKDSGTPTSDIPVVKLPN